MSSGLLRYRSAPSTILQDTCEDFLPVRPTSPETESMFARFLAAPPDLRTQIRDKPTEQMTHFSASQMMYPVGSMAMDSDQIKTGSSGLTRHSSSPAGLNGYGLMRGSQAGRQINFNSRQNSLSQISEMGGSSPEESGGGGRGYIPGFPVGTWEESSMLSENFSGMKRNREVGGAKLGVGGLNQSESQFQDAVLCKMRAKRGCATHPRSIAERVRRTRISERMRKLQELVPNMDKQTNTADMLDLAVEYIKDLQGQVQTLSESRASCTCSSSKRKPYTNPSL